MNEDDISRVPLAVSEPPHGARSREAADAPVDRPFRPRRRWWKILVLAVPLALVAAVGVVLGAYVYALTRITAGGGNDGIPKSRAGAYAFPLRLVDRVNILIVGIDITLDNKRRVLDVARADTLVLVTFDPERGRIAAVSIPRDTRTVIPGRGDAKVNASYAYGGPRLTTRTVEQLLGVKVDAYVKLGAESFSKLIDAMGGIDIDVEKDMKYRDTWAGYTIDLKKGPQRLNGYQAMGYVRFRHDALGDIGRVERQHKVLLALLKELRQPTTIVRAPDLLRAFAEHTQTTLTSRELMTLGVFALRLRDRPLQLHTLPGTFGVTFWEPDQPKVRALVADLFYGVALRELADMRVEIVNGSGYPAAGRRLAERLAELGFRTVKLRAASPHDGVTTVIDRSGRRGVGRMVAVAIGRAVVRHEPHTSDEPAVTILVTRDAARSLLGNSADPTPTAAGGTK